MCLREEKRSRGYWTRELFEFEYNDGGVCISLTADGLMAFTNSINLP